MNTQYTSQNRVSKVYLDYIWNLCNFGEQTLHKYVERSVFSVYLCDKCLRYNFIKTQKALIEKNGI